MKWGELLQKYHNGEIEFKSGNLRFRSLLNLYKQMTEEEKKNFEDTNIDVQDETEWMIKTISGL